MSTKKKEPGTETTMDVDYILTYKFVDEDQASASAQFEKLIEALDSVGFATEVRIGDKTYLLVFAKLASEDHLYAEVYRSRVKDWLHGVRASAPDPEKDAKDSEDEEPLSSAERLRILYQLITNPERQGGAGITPGKGKWSNVESVFALHDHEFNREWLKKWASSSMLKVKDLDEIRNKFGEKVAFYFAFTQSYFTALIGISAFGAASWVLLGGFSPVYAIANTLLCVSFIEYWKYQEENLAVRWGVKGVSSIESKRHNFSPEKEIQDPVTGESVQFFPTRKRLRRQLLQIPFALAAAAALGALIALCFSIEIFISEVYQGPGKSVLVFVPTMIMTTVQPLLLGFLTNTAEKLTLFENYETHGAYETAMTQKIFVLNFITSYLGIFLTAFVYVPFATVLVPYLDIFQLTVKPFAKNAKQTRAPRDFDINPNRLKKQVIYFTVTAQIVNQALEVVVPYLKRRGITQLQDVMNKRAAKKDVPSALPSDPASEDQDDETAFLRRVRKEAALPAYDVTTDFREMIVQYGYLTLFSVVWPLTPISFLVNNWIELRTDAAKICHEARRPTPWRAEGIGPWLDSLGFLTWLGSITTAAIVYLFAGGADADGPGGDPAELKAWILLLTIFCSEHAYLLVRWAGRLFVSKLDSPGRQKERAERFRVRRRYLEQSHGELAARVRRPSAKPRGEGATGAAAGAEQTQMQGSTPDRASLEEEARRGAMGSTRLEDRFWMRQQGWQEAAAVGKKLIERGTSVGGAKGKKTQ